MSELTRIEREDNFVLPDVIVVPPCGEIYPNGVTMRLRRVIEGDLQVDHFAHYVGSPDDSPKGASPVVTVSAVDDRQCSRVDGLYRIDAAHDEEHQEVGEGAPPYAAYGITKNPAWNPPWGPDVPFGIEQTMLTQPDVCDLKAAVEFAVRTVVFNQGCAVESHARSLERGISIPQRESEAAHER